MADGLEKDGGMDMNLIRMDNKESKAGTEVNFVLYLGKPVHKKYWLVKYLCKKHMKEIGRIVHDAHQEILEVLRR